VKGCHDIRGIFSIFNKPFILLLLGSTITTCIDPFNPNLSGQKAILVVDALLTNENRSYTVKLSYTTQSQNEDPAMASSAFVTISDWDGNVTRLTETTNGIYKTDSLAFQGETGNTYTLYIKTFEGAEYRSEPCTINPVKQIDRIYFQKDQEIPKNSSEILEGIRIFLDSENSGGGKYFRWIYDEWWKFSVPYPKRFDYIDENNIPEVDQIKQVCYAHDRTDEILINSSESSQTNRIEREPILFLSPDLSDRFLIQYCIDIKQLSLSAAEFQFWEQMKEINESGGDIFDKQPFSIIGNIHNVNNPLETVLGYFQVSAVEEKRIYISPQEIKDLELPVYSYDCEAVEVAPNDYPPPTTPADIMTFDKIYEFYRSTGYIFVRPIYDMFGNLNKLVFTKPVCALCIARGNLVPPDFWIDMEPSQ
jgi:hypothetical protein